VLDFCSTADHRIVDTLARVDMALGQVLRAHLLTLSPSANFKLTSNRLAGVDLAPSGRGSDAAPARENNVGAAAILVLSPAKCTRVHTNSQPDEKAKAANC
jgi:hypothetical protein